MTFEDPHVAEFRDPPNATRMPAGKDLAAMLLAGEIDAAILAEPPKDGPLRPLIPDPAAAAAGLEGEAPAPIQINHMVTVKNTVSDSQAQDIYSAVEEEPRSGGQPGDESVRPGGEPPQPRGRDRLHATARG